MTVTGAPRRVQSYSLKFKLELVAEALAPGASVSAISRRRNVNANLIFTWRKQYRAGRLGPPGALDGSPAFVPVGIVDGTGQAMPVTCLPVLEAPQQQSSAAARTAPKPTPVSRAIELELRNGIKLRLDAGMATDTLRRVLRAVMTA
jgi:transposase